MKTVLFLEKTHSISGGIQRVNSNLATAMKQMDTTPIFYIYDTVNNKEGFEKLKLEHIAFTPPQSESFLSKLRHLFTTVNEQDVAYIIAATETANILAMICSIRFPAVKVLYTRHCAFDVADQKLSPFKIKLLYNLYAITRGRIGAVSEALKDEIVSHVLFNKSSVAFYPNAVVGTTVLNAAKVNEDNPYIGSRYFCAVGRLSEQKGFDLLLQAYAKANADQTSNLPKLVIVGEGTLHESLNKLAIFLGVSNLVVFHGYTSNPYPIIKHAEAFLLSSRHEGMPTVLIEAMFLNTPVIAFDCPTGPSEIVKDGVNGYLIENGNVDLFSNAILNFDSTVFSDIKGSVSQFEFANSAKFYLNKLKRA